MCPHCARGEACSAVPHFDELTAGGSGRRVHEASQACLPWHGVCYHLLIYISCNRKKKYNFCQSFVLTIPYITNVMWTNLLFQFV